MSTSSITRAHLLPGRKVTSPARNRSTRPPDFYAQRTVTVGAQRPALDTARRLRDADLRAAASRKLGNAGERRKALAPESIQATQSLCRRPAGVAAPADRRRKLRVDRRLARHRLSRVARIRWQRDVQAKADDYARSAARLELSWISSPPSFR